MPASSSERSDRQTTSSSSSASSPVKEFVKRHITYMLADGIEYTDLMKIVAKSNTMNEWCVSWIEEALLHQKIAEEALSQGNTLTAGEAYLRA
ncbi:MAG: hypothetical protein ACREBS_03060 [Nitrososphaerales archaeon]